MKCCREQNKRKSFGAMPAQYADGGEHQNSKYETSVSFELYVAKGR